MRKTLAAKVAIGNSGFAASKCIWNLYQISSAGAAHGAIAEMDEFSETLRLQTHQQPS
jgi:hypothetical protein